LARRGGDADESHRGADGGFIYRFSRGLGMARSGNVAGAKAEIEAMKAVRTALQRAINPTGPTARRADAGYFRLGGVKEGARDQAVRFMRAAADGEDASISRKG